nr:helix-turn-helix domain-containing protein [Actinospica robiniae]
MSTEWYTRLEKGHIGGVSEDVLDAVARALRLNDDERTYLFDLARSSRQQSRTPPRRRDVEVPPRVQWLLDSMTTSSAFVRNGRTDILAGNALARALFAPMFDSATTDKHGRPNLARYIFLDPDSHDLFVDWDAAGMATAALLRAEVGREPRDRALRELVGELLELTFQSLELPLPGRAAHDLIIYTAEPGTASEDRLDLLAIWAATQSAGRITPARQ